MRTDQSRARTLMQYVIIALLGTSCSVDVLPISASRVQSLRKANQAIARGPNSPGAFNQAWTFGAPGGYLIDPAKIEFVGGVARVKASATHQPQVIQTTIGRPYVVLDRFVETLGPSNHGKIRYQLSNDGSRWYWFDGSKWTIAAANFNQANSAADVNQHISSFHLDAGHGSFYFKAYLSALSENESAELMKIEVAGIAPENDTWN